MFLAKNINFEIDSSSTIIRNSNNCITYFNNALFILETSVKMVNHIFGDIDNHSQP